MYINFKYKIPSNITELAISDIENFPSNGELNGYIDEFDIYNKNLKYCSMYLVCELEAHINTNDRKLLNPYCIVAKNEFRAIDAFYNITKKNNGTVMCEIINNCSNIKVIPTGIKV